MAKKMEDVQLGENLNKLRTGNDKVGMSSGSSVGLKSSRKICYESRDRFLECSDRNNGDESKCKKERAAFDKDCPASWVAHFIRKHKYLKYKDELSKEGFLPADQRQEDVLRKAAADAQRGH
ncbi:Cytochrome c oxidase assembly factor 6 -like protein [Toxocara canis]|uniref:Cytochrome c oxidase assembly factor 6-like protein n=1 Tax=Toxocara canis TaxID=6265 RepID=A0A0B2VZV0_TOXCA|nr:Cytochrome c oxidase assembly factor 6 -like protein [Toxocara canis]